MLQRRDEARPHDETVRAAGVDGGEGRARRVVGWGHVALFGCGSVSALNSRRATVAIAPALSGPAGGAAVAGVALVAELPPGLSLATRYTAGVALRAPHPQAARELVKLLAGEATADHRRRAGFV